MDGSSEFSVAVTRREVVTAALPLQENWLPLSNLDLLLPPLDVGVFFCYRKPAGVTTSVISVLKKSLGQALVVYYPFAGEVVPNPAGEPELLCNNRGVEFVEALADVELVNLNLYNPDESVEKKLVPEKKHGVLCVQATELKCGGLVVACSFDHRVADAHSANMFFVAWTEVARSTPLSCVPSFRRSMIAPRHPGHYDASIDDYFVPLSSLPRPDLNDATSVQQISRIYCVSAGDIARIQAAASTAGGKRTKLEAFTAYIWRILGGARSFLSKCNLGIVVDGRTRLDDSMAAYFGNVLSVPYGTLAGEELRRMELGEVAAMVHKCVSRAATQEHFLWLVDWVEAHRPEPAVTRIYTLGGGKKEDDVAVVMSSGLRFPVEKVDFGCGRPVFGSYHFPWGGTAGYVMPMPSATRSGDWVVYVHLTPDLVEALEAAAGDVFRPLTAHHLVQSN